jgi:hypothetical protein
MILMTLLEVLNDLPCHHINPKLKTKTKPSKVSIIRNLIPKRSSKKSSICRHIPHFSKTKFVMFIKPLTTNAHAHTHTQIGHLTLETKEWSRKHGFTLTDEQQPDCRYKKTTAKCEYKIGNQKQKLQSV